MDDKSQNKPKFTTPKETTTEQKLSQGFIRKVVPKYVFVIPWVLICLIATFTAMIMDFFIPSNGVNSSNKTITNLSNATNAFECNEWFRSNEQHICEWTFQIDNVTGRYPIQFGVISTSNKSYPYLPPFYVISNSRKDICGQPETCTLNHELKIGDIVKVKLNLPKRRLTVKINENDEYLVTENIWCNDAIKYKCCVILNNANDSVTLKDFNHLFLCEQTESKMIPNKEHASYDNCHSFDYFCDCGCNTRFNNYTLFKNHKFRIYEKNGNWKDCDCGSFHTNDNKTCALLHEFTHATRKPFACAVQTDGVKCTERFSRPVHLCYHLNNVHYKGATDIKPTETSYSNVTVEPSASHATYKNTTIFEGTCPGCDKTYHDISTFWKCIKSHSSLRVNDGKTGPFKCNLITTDDTVCNKQCNTKAIFLKHMGSTTDHKAAIRPLVCSIKENDIMCGATFHTQQPKIFQNHKNKKHYENKKIIKK